MINTRVIRFGLVGLVNTGVDIGIYAALTTSGVPIVLANTCSTSVALLVSLVLNSKFTFSGSKLTKAGIVRFVAITLGGLWLLQPLVILLARHLVSLGGKPRMAILILVPKLAATAVTLVWNYTLYSRFVYHKPTA